MTSFVIWVFYLSYDVMPTRIGGSPSTLISNMCQSRHYITNQISTQLISEVLLVFKLHLIDEYLFSLLLKFATHTCVPINSIRGSLLFVTKIVRKRLHESNNVVNACLLSVLHLILKVLSRGNIWTPFQTGRIELIFVVSF